MNKEMAIHPALFGVSISLSFFLYSFFFVGNPNTTDIPQIVVSHNSLCPLQTLSISSNVRGIPNENKEFRQILSDIFTSNIEQKNHLFLFV